MNLEDKGLKRMDGQFQDNGSNFHFPVLLKNSKYMGRATVLHRTKMASNFAQLKSEATVHFTASEYLLAIEKYATALRIAVTDDQRLLVHSNIALCHLRLGSPKLAIGSCNSALSCGAATIKVLYRRAQV